MASPHANTHSEPAKNEQILTEFFAKSLHIILESRCPYVSSRNYSGEQVLSSPSSSSSSSSFRPRDKWFNLALRDCPAAFENIDFWRQSNLEPMIVDVVLMQRPSNWDPLNFSPNKGLVRNLSGKERLYYGSVSDEFRREAKSEEIVERWVLQYESKKTGGSGGGSFGSKRSSNTSSHALYKKSILALRSLYATVRLLPAYKLFRDLISSAQLRSYNLGHRVSSFVEPFTRQEEADMQHFVFTPIETSCGRICLSVMYRPSVSEVNSEPSTPMSPQFIPEYVGSPLAERLKRFPSGPISQSSPSSSPSFVGDDYDDSEFSGAFFVDDDDVMDPCSRQGSVDVPVGAVVHMLKKAPPLRKDVSVTTHCLQGSELLNYMQQESNEKSGEAETRPHALSVSSSSGLISSKTTADALEELRGYRAMTKELLLKQGKVPPGE